MKCRGLITLVLSLMLATTDWVIVGNLKLRVLAQSTANCTRDTAIAKITSIEGSGQVWIWSGNISLRRGARLNESLCHGDLLEIERGVRIWIRCIGNGDNLIEIRTSFENVSDKCRNIPQSDGKIIPMSFRRNDSGSEVVAIQQLLRSLKYENVKPTGYFDEITENAVIQFQQEYGDSGDGIVDQLTRTRLFKSVAYVLTNANKTNQYFDKLEPGDLGLQVKEIQQYLRTIGFDPGPVNGIYNLQTEDALRHFQVENNLRISGVIDRKTLDKLRQIAIGNVHHTINTGF